MLRFRGAYTWRGLFSEFCGTLSSCSYPLLRVVLVPETPCNSISSVSHTVSRLKHTHEAHQSSTSSPGLFPQKMGGKNPGDEVAPAITHFVEHSTRLYDCKSSIMDSFYKLATENDFFSVYLTHINCDLFSCRYLNDNELKSLPSGIFSNLFSLRIL